MRLLFILLLLFPAVSFSEIILVFKSGVVYMHEEGISQNSELKLYQRIRVTEALSIHTEKGSYAVFADDSGRIAEVYQEKEVTTAAIQKEVSQAQISDFVKSLVKDFIKKESGNNIYQKLQVFRFTDFVFNNTKALKKEYSFKLNKEVQPVQIRIKDLYGFELSYLETTEKEYFIDFSEIGDTVFGIEIKGEGWLQKLDVVIMPANEYTKLVYELAQVKMLKGTLPDFYMDVLISEIYFRHGLYLDFVQTIRYLREYDPANPSVLHRMFPIIRPTGLIEER